MFYLGRYPLRRAASRVGADTRLQELSGLSDAQAQQTRLADKSDVCINILNSYIRALKSPSSVQYAISTLLDKQLLTYDDQGRTKIYSLSDRFLSMWLSRTY